MSTLSAALTVAAILGFSLPAAYWQIRRAARHESTRDRTIREAHERAETACQQDDIELIWSMPAYTGPDLEGRIDRLRQANRDQQREENGP